jgi:hypothetical protein
MDASSVDRERRRVGVSPSPTLGSGSIAESTNRGSADATPSSGNTAGSGGILGVGSTGGSTVGNTPPEGGYSQHQIVFVLFFFAGSSLGAVFVNKACLTHYRFSHPFIIMLGQAVSAVICMSVLSRFRPNILTIAPVKKEDMSRLALPTALFVANVSVGLSALTLVNIPMFSAFRRLTVLFVMLAEFVFLRRTHSRRVVASVCLLAAGAFVSAVGDVTFSRLGYTLVFLNNILTATYLASIKRVMRDLNLDPLSLLYYTALIAICPVAFICIVSGDLRAAVDAYSSRPDLQSSIFFVPSLLLVAASAFCVNLSTSLCTHATSPLTTSVVGQVKNVLQTVLGFFSWGYVPTTMNLSGLAVALAGQLLFGYFKYIETNRDDGYSREVGHSMSKVRQASTSPERSPRKTADEQEAFLGNGNAGLKLSVN